MYVELYVNVELYTYVLFGIIIYSGTSDKRPLENNVPVHNRIGPLLYIEENGCGVP